MFLGCTFDYYSTSVYNYGGTFVQVTNWALSQVSDAMCHWWPFIWKSEFYVDILYHILITASKDCAAHRHIREFVQAMGSLQPGQIATVSLICVVQTGKPHCGFMSHLITSSHFISY